MKSTVDRRQALTIARYMGCRGAHRSGDGGWMPCADMDTLTVTAADKAHNARSIATDLQNQGPSLWDRFNAQRDDIIWYYESVYAVLRQRQVSATLLIPLRNAIDVMQGK